MATVSMTGVRLGGWTASDLLFFAASFAIALQLLTGRRKYIAPVAARRSSPGILVGLIVLSVGALIATVGRSLDPAGSALVLSRLWYITIVWFWTLRSATTSRAFFRRLLLAAIVGAAINASVGIVQDVTGANAVAPTWGRSRGLSDHFNDLGLAVGSIIPILAVWRNDGASQSRLGPRRVIAMLILLGGVGVSGSLSGTGGAMVGTAVALAAPRLVDPLRRRKRSVAPLAVAVVAAVLVMSGVVALPVQSRFSELGSDSSYTAASAETRSKQAEIALAGITESPLVGVGLDSTSAKVDDGAAKNAVHNFYVRTAYEAGVLGLIGVVMIVLMVCRQVWQLMRVTRRTTLIWMPAGLMGSLAAYLTAALFSHIQYGRTSWLPMALISTLYGLARAGLLKGDEEPGSAVSSVSPDSSRGMR